MQALIALLFIPIVILNFAGGIVGGIWLGIDGQWAALGIGIAALIGGSFAIGLAMLPGFGITALSIPLIDRGHTMLAMPFMLVGTAWTYAIMGAWCLGSFYFILRGHDEGSIWPFLLWAYSTAVGPWLYMASKEGHDAHGSTIASAAACFGSLAIIGVIVFKSRPTVIDAAVACGACLVLGFLLQAALGIAIAIEERRLRSAAAARGPEVSSW